MHLYFFFCVNHQMWQKFRTKNIFAEHQHKKGKLQTSLANKSSANGSHMRALDELMFCNCHLQFSTNIPKINLIMCCHEELCVIYRFCPIYFKWICFTNASGWLLLVYSSTVAISFFIIRVLLHYVLYGIISMRQRITKVLIKGFYVKLIHVNSFIVCWVWLRRNSFSTS